MRGFGEGGADLNRKHLNGQATPAPAPLQADIGTWGNGVVNPSDVHNQEARRWSGSIASSNDLGGEEYNATSHVPHQICKL